MNRRNNKSEKPERKSPPHGRTKENKRRKYSSIWQLDLVERVERVARIRRFLERSLECDLEIDGINL